MENQEYLLFEAYLEGTLSDKEQKDFELQLLDKTFLKEFESYKEATKFLEHHLGNKEAQKSFEANLNTAEEQHIIVSKPKGKVINMNFWKYAAAASVLLLVGLFVFQNNGDPTYKDFMDYPEVSLTTRGASNETIQRAETFFNTKQFEAAVVQFNKVLENEPNNLEIKLYKAISLMETEKYTEAEKIFKSIGSGNSVYKDEGLWYFALSKLKQNNLPECKNILQQISKEYEAYGKVKKLLQRL